MMSGPELTYQKSNDARYKRCNCVIGCALPQVFQFFHREDGDCRFALCGIDDAARAVHGFDDAAAQIDVRIPATLGCSSINHCDFPIPLLSGWYQR